MEESFRFEPGDALLVVDVLNDFEHEDGDDLLSSVRERSDAMLALLSQARDAGIPVVYVNDAAGQWDGDVRTLVARAHDAVRPLAPRPGEAVLLKHRYSGFDHTPLELLLAELHVERLVLSGSATEGCVVQTAIDARERRFKVTIVADACATTDPHLEEIALRYAAEVGGARVASLEPRAPAQRTR